jgi:eukaryotic-like serine/threonine-protein kinase
MVSVWMVPVDGNAKPIAVVQPPSTQSNIFAYRVSPDGHWLAYASDESGQLEIYITSFPDAKGTWRVSSNSGTYPAWRGDGKEVFYETVTNDYFACSVTAQGSELIVGAPVHLFHTNTPGLGISYDVSSDGKRLLVNRSEEETQTPLQLNTNWLAELKK